LVRHIKQQPKQESAMTLRDGRIAQDAYFAGGGYVRAKVWVGAKNERERGCPEWAAVPLNLMPEEWLREMQAAAQDSLRIAA
jgi:hypothetical protein